ncbi:SDR family NAD(P)-dependent oxidoreductase [Streptomyces sp. HNM0574]|uniref:SDR family NAD(P)-dependent oxidoreductase n=1 Tax=Streptomyces sp. HNM0574 TaxID=2714954 RepID=UPI00146B1B4A|nr:SDR family NAD(P)-dependent oxidoreductase [Streptomyces sp. HNM0574]NLU70589.1 SDR family NAD(P)-dependent oxidoreductase [Streptomyces sp. HNM0574]
MEPLRFDDRVAVITGAGRGIGAAHARLLAARGCQVVINDLGVTASGTGGDTTPARATADAIRAAGGTAISDTSDIAAPEGARELVRRAVDAFGRVDIVINNAGIYELDSFPELELDDLRRHWDVHVGGSFNVTRAAWPELSARGDGRVVMTTSTGALGASTMTSYGSAKAGVAGLARALAQSGAASGIKVNLVAPFADTRMNAIGTGRAEDDVPADAEQRTADLVSPMVACLAHESCPVTGETFLSGMGRFARFFIAETDGYLPEDPPTIESLATHWNTITDPSRGYGITTDVWNWSERNAGVLGGGRG